MKKILMAIALLTGIHSFGQWGPWEQVEGNGNLKKETRTAGNFTSLGSSGSWDVVIAYGESNAIKVEADENLLNYIETKVEDGKLNIRQKRGYNIRSKNKVTIYVSMSKIAGISLSGSGNISGEGSFSNDGNTDFHLSGSGNIKISFNKVKEVTASISGSGNIRLSGSAASVTARISGSGNADCSELVCDDVSASISGSGNVKITANKSIDAKIAGSGNVYYKGNPTDIQRHVAGSGRVVKS